MAPEDLCGCPWENPAIIRASIWFKALNVVSSCPQSFFVRNKEKEHKKAQLANDTHGKVFLAVHVSEVGCMFVSHQHFSLSHLQRIWFIQSWIEHEHCAKCTACPQCGTSDCLLLLQPAHTMQNQIDTEKKRHSTQLSNPQVKPMHRQKLRNPLWSMESWISHCVNWGHHKKKMLMHVTMHLQKMSPLLPTILQNQWSLWLECRNAIWSKISNTKTPNL